MKIEERLLTIGEVSKFLGIHRDTARRWAKQGKLKAITINDRGTLRFFLSSINEFVYGNKGDDKEEEKVEIKTIEDAVRYTLHNNMFKDDANGLSAAAYLIEEKYGFEYSEVIEKIMDMMDNGVILSKGKYAYAEMKE